MPFLTLNDQHIEFERIAGAGNVAPIVMLHEGLGSVAMWRDFPKALAAASSRTVVLYSRLGYGKSESLDWQHAPRTPTFMHDEAWVTLPALLRALYVERPVLFGHSDGASIALLHAARHAVSGVVALAPHVKVEPISHQGIEEARAAYLSTDLRRKLAAYHDDVDSAFYGWNDIWRHPDFATWNIEAELATISAPVLAMQGEQDNYGTFEQIESIQRHAQGAHVKLLKLPQCGHVPQRDQRDIVLSATVSFLASLNPELEPPG